MNEEKPKYEKDGENILLKKPIHFPKENKLIYESVDNPVTHMDNFSLKCGNDNFFFVCENGHIADVLKVLTIPQPYNIRFSLGCPVCGKTGTKTIELKP
jgi:hypothetical protein